MTKEEFEGALNRCCEILTLEAREKGFRSANDFEARVRETLAELTKDDPELKIDFNSPAQAFPDIAMGTYGVEVKYTTANTWRSVANSIQETQRVQGVMSVYIVFGKMGGIPEVRWGEYEESVIHVRTSHVPRFEVEIATDKTKAKPSLFKRMGIRYDDFRRLDMSEKIKYIRKYARQIHPDGRLWWLENEKEEHTLPVNVRLYTNLEQTEKTRLRAEAALVSPRIVKSGRDRKKYDDVVLYLLTYHGVLCHQARDLFSAGSVAAPERTYDGGNYIQKALVLIQDEMRKAALEMDDAIFVEYWGESVPPEKRISKWLEKADALAVGWKPSDVLFRA